MLQEFTDSMLQRSGILELALPDREDFPTAGAKRSTVLIVASPVGIQLGRPELDAGLGKPGQGATRAMAMPKATVHE